MTTMVTKQHRRFRINSGKIFWFLFLAALTTVVMMPTLWIVSQSLMPEHEILKWPIRLIPNPITLDNYARVLSIENPRQELPIFRWTFNSVFIAFTNTFLTLLVSSMAAYPLARMEFP